MFWLNLYSARVCCIDLIDKLLQLFPGNGKVDKVCSPLVVKSFVDSPTEAKIKNDLVVSFSYRRTKRKNKVQISVFIDRLCVMFDYMHSYLPLLCQNINSRNKLHSVHWKRLAFPGKFNDINK